MHENEIAREIVDASLEVHRQLGPGLFESVYQVALEDELEARSLRTLAQVPIPISYGGHDFDAGFRADLIVEDKVIVEIKSLEVILRVHKKQLLTYLRLADKRLGLLINFGSAMIRGGISRIVNRLEEG
jgi:GxxExxY protein